MRILILLIATGGLLVFTAGAWTFTFWHILTHGSVTFYENTLPVLFTEVIMAILMTILGLVATVYAIIKSKEGKNGVSGMD